MNKDFILRNSMLNELFMADFEDVRKVADSFDEFVPNEAKEEFKAALQMIESDLQAKLKSSSGGQIGDVAALGDTDQFKTDEAKDEAKAAMVNLIKKHFSLEYYKEMVANPDKYVHKTKKERTKYDLYLQLSIIRKHLAPFLSVVGFYGRRGIFLSQDTIARINREYNKAIKSFNCYTSRVDKSVDIFYRPTCMELAKQEGFIDLDEKSMINLIFPYLDRNVPELCRMAEIVHAWVVGKDSWAFYHPEMTKEEKDEAYRKELYARTAEFVDQCRKDGILEGK